MDASPTSSITGGEEISDPRILKLDTANLREISGQAVWLVSTFKSGFGVDQLCDNSFDTYWQSDGPQPHSINIQFPKRTSVKEIALYLDYKQDESYTPLKISVKAGNTFHDLLEVQLIELEEPIGWTVIPLGDEEQLRAHLFQISIILNHQNGRDSHIRQVKVFSSYQRALTPGTMIR